MQDLIGIAVVMQHDGSSLGTVVDVYDGTGEKTSCRRLIDMVTLASFGVMTKHIQLHPEA